MENTTNNLQRLYHYTSVETLLKILSSHSLRFNNLTLMDDPDEQKSKELKNAGRWTFISSWTTLRDNRMMFATYGQNYQGVCISLPLNPFYLSFGNPYKNNELISSIDKSKIKIEPFEYTEGIEKYIDEYNFVFYPSTVETVLVKYSDDDAELYPSILTNNKEKCTYFDGILGRYKDTSWSFQNEVRYRLRPTQLVSNFVNVNSDSDFNKFTQQMIINKLFNKCPADYMDIPIDLNGLEIILGSKISQDNVERIYDMICQQKLIATISRSMLKIK